MATDYKIVVGYLPKASSDVDVCSKGAALHMPSVHSSV